MKVKIVFSTFVMKFFFNVFRIDVGPEDVYLELNTGEKILYNLESITSIYVDEHQEWYCGGDD